MEAYGAKWLEQFFDEVTPAEFYRDMWPAGELGARGEKVKGEYQGIAVAILGNRRGRPRTKRFLIYDDLETVNKLATTDYFCLCSPISYAGNHRTAENARHLYGIAIDLDNLRQVGDQPSGLKSLWNAHIERENRIPKPTYIVSSGTGLHLYYFLERPIALYQNTAKELQRLKWKLTRLVWGFGIVDIKDERDIQQEGIYQGFRMPGTITKTGGRARAFLTGPRWTVEGLDEYAKVFDRDIKYTVKKELTLDQAREKFPEWYQRRVVNKEPRGVWHVSRNVYEWWLNEIRSKAEVGHRYYCIMTLVIYAKKCSMYDAKHNPNPVTYKELERDCFGLLELMESRTTDENNHFTLADIQDALEAYEYKWITYPRNSIAYKSGIPVPANKRNGQKQAEHLEEARAIRDIRQKRAGTRWTDQSGRPSKQMEVEAWQRFHPGATKAECIRATGISKPTVYKYWK